MFAPALVLFWGIMLLIGAMIGAAFVAGVKGKI